MNEEKNKVGSSTEEGILQRATKLFKEQIELMNAKFNSLSIRTKQVYIVSFGITVAILCLEMIFQAFLTKIDDTIRIDKITQPKDVYMHNSDTTKQLIPVGKLKGEIDGEFEAFYVAVDDNGQVFINRNPSFGANRFIKSEEWKSITHQQLEAYQKELHFFPHKLKGLKR